LTADPTIDSLNYAKPALPMPGIELLEPEPRWKRYIYGLIALALSIGFFYTVMSYWVPAHGGTDQNGYLVGGKMFAQTLTMRLSPIHPGSRDEFDPHQFVGRMWVGAGLGTPDERYYPKYPLGLPAIYASLLWIASLLGPGWNLWLTYGVSPVAMSLAVLGSYLLARRFAGSFGGLLTAVVFATSPVTLQLAINPNSHAAAVCCVVWGMYFLIGWWQFRGMLRAIAAGFLLGYAGTIRYSEGTLILPIVLVALFTVWPWRFSRERGQLQFPDRVIRWLPRPRVAGRFRYLITWVGLRWLLDRARRIRLPHLQLRTADGSGWRTVAQAALLVSAWAVPMGALVAYNHFAIGDLTGYGPTNESTGFTLGYGADNWETMLRSINSNGLAQMFPLALAGLFWMFWWNWRAACVVASWIVPCILIYTFYYWAPDNLSLSYLRFFTTILPGLAMCFFWLVSRLNAWAAGRDRGGASLTMTVPIVIVAGLLVTVATALPLDRAWNLEHGTAGTADQSNRIDQYLRLSTADPDADTDTPHDARIQFDANRCTALAAGIAGALVALAFARGRVLVPAVGAGLFTGMVIAMHLANAMPAMEMDQSTRYQLDFKAQAIRAEVPDGSVIVCQEDNLLNDIQFIGDYALYDGRSFRRDIVQNLPNADPPDQPQGLDPGRRDALYKRLKDFSQPALDEQARRIMRDALNANRRVFFVIQARPNDPIPKTVRKAVGSAAKVKNVRMPDFVARLCTPDRFATEVVSVWPGYVPGISAPQINKPRGIRVDRPADPQVARQAIELIEVTLRG
jgi:hypothetical protein